jgi:hypothetical protein
MPTVNFGFKDVLVRSQLPPEALRRSLEQEVHALDPRVPLTEAQSMSEYLGDLTAVKRFTSEILACFAGLGLVLAVMGIYGVISFLVAQRTQEIGIRLALGAPRAMVLWLAVSARIADDACGCRDWPGGNSAGGAQHGKPALRDFVAGSLHARLMFPGPGGGCAAGLRDSGTAGSCD